MTYKGVGGRGMIQLHRIHDGRSQYLLARGRINNEMMKRTESKEKRFVGEGVGEAGAII